jgi:3-methyladenine DNA glycosylase AlkD
LEVQSLSVNNSPNRRKIRRKYSKLLTEADSCFVLEIGRGLRDGGQFGMCTELISNHKLTFNCLNQEILEDLGKDINSWWTVDAFARDLSGPAWLAGLIKDDVIHAWARSESFWWRRAALVSTVALNSRSQGGKGDTDRTLAVCRLLVSDYEDMVVKGMSWALRDLIWHDRKAVQAFLEKHEDNLAARVKREVRNKLETGLKNPRKGK